MFAVHVTYPPTRPQPISAQGEVFGRPPDTRVHAGAFNNDAIGIEVLGNYLADELADRGGAVYECLPAY